MKYLAIILLGGVTFTGAVLYAQTPRKLPQKPTLPPKTKSVNPLLLPTPKPGEVQRPEMPELPEEPKGKDDPYLYPWGRLATRETKPQGVILTLQGDAHLLYKDSKFLSDTVLYNQDTEIGSAPGKVKLDDAQNTITADRGTAFYAKNRKEVLMEGSVVIVARPKQGETSNPKSLRKDFKSPVTITCDRANYKWKDRHGWSNSNVRVTTRARERDWVIVAEQMDYFGKDERIVLKGKVFAKSSRGEEIYADLADVVLKEGSEDVKLSPIKGGTKIRLEDDDDDTPTEKPAEKPVEIAKPEKP